MKPRITYNGRPLEEVTVFDPDNGLTQPTEEETIQILESMSHDTWRQWQDLSDGELEDIWTD